MYWTPVITENLFYSKLCGKFYIQSQYMKQIGHHNSPQTILMIICLSLIKSKVPRDVIFCLLWNPGFVLNASKTLSHKTFKFTVYSSLVFSPTLCIWNVLKIYLWYLMHPLFNSGLPKLPKRQQKIHYAGKRKLIF